ncbi:hypothetical protein [Cyanobium sp. HWJ4-Hawea]|uniref:hypothetical protein n=1 Tax=Cyanobium sp. HWJ4-Hawea TaxID=2823713 RepID=UPI0020CD2153|nr:hypothetical protein [Cyanobium sp. HWJ4-Hawea]
MKVLPKILDQENEHIYFWAISVYAIQGFEELLNIGGFEGLIHEKGSRNHHLQEAGKELNRLNSAIKDCVDHVFGCMTMSMGGKLTIKIGLERTKAWWGQKILVLNLLRCLHSLNP